MLYPIITELTTVATLNIYELDLSLRESRWQASGNDFLLSDSQFISPFVKTVLAQFVTLHTEMIVCQIF